MHRRQRSYLPESRINTCARRIVNKAPPLPPSLSISGHTDIWSILSRILKMGKRDTGRFRDALIGGKEGGKRGASPVHDFGDPQRDSAFRLICSTANLRANPYYLLWGAGARSLYGVVHRARFFAPVKNPLPSATRPCCGRRSCPASRCPVFGYGTDCSHVL